MARNRIIYASQSVWCNGEVLYRVQSLGSTTTFTNEDIFELGHLDIVDVVDDVPAVAVTLNTNDFGDVKTLAILAQVSQDRLAMDATASVSNANLVAGGSTYLHGVALADFAVTCGNLTGVTIWAPVQDECDLGTLANNIEQTLFLDEVYVNSLEFSYTTGANATENYGAETDLKMWLLNDGRFVNYDSYTVSGTETSFDLTLASGNNVAVLSNNTLGFLRKDESGLPGITWFDYSENEVMNVAVVSGIAAASDTFVYHDTGSAHTIYFPTGSYNPDPNDMIMAIYAADAYGTGTSNKYFEVLNDADRPSEVGALRQGQVEVYIVDPDNYSAYENAWRLTGVTISADITREPLLEIGHLGPYDRPVTVPIPITVTVDSTMGDLENWARFAGKDFDSDLDDLDLSDMMNKENLVLVVKVFKQTDEEANGTGSGRKVQADMVGENFWNDGSMAAYASAGDTEYALKTIVVEHLKITDEGQTLDIGANMTQTFGFRSTNDLYVVKGDVSIGSVAAQIRRNAA